MKLTKLKPAKTPHKVFLTLTENIFQYLEVQSNYYGISMQEFIRNFIIREMNQIRFRQSFETDSAIFQTMDKSINEDQNLRPDQRQSQEQKRKQSRAALTIRQQDNIERAVKQKESYKYKSISNSRDIRELLENPKFVSFNYYNKD